MITEDPAAVALLLLALLAAYLLAHAGAVAVWRAVAARRAVYAECLTCTYLEAGKDVRAARAAGAAHGEATGHPLMLRHHA